MLTFPHSFGPLIYPIDLRFYMRDLFNLMCMGKVSEVHVTNRMNVNFELFSAKVIFMSRNFELEVSSPLTLNYSLVEFSL